MTKQITLDNWNQLDPTALIFAQMTERGFENMTAEDWVKASLEITLPSTLPEEIQTLFASAQACLVYGVYYYPLFTLGMEHMTRVLEAAVSWYAQQVGIPAVKASGLPKTLGTYLRDLLQHQFITQDEFDRLDGHWREFRNMFAHPKSRDILTPAAALGICELLTAEITGLAQKLTLT